MSPDRASLADLVRVFRLWGRQRLWLFAGVVISLAAVAAGTGLLTQAGRSVAAAVIVVLIAAPGFVALLGAARVALRYLERVVTHEATFRALADLRVWFFRGLSRRAAGGLGWRRSGDVLSRLVNDVEALDGLYLRITVPGVAAIVLLPTVLALFWRHGPVLATGVTALFAIAALGLPLLAAGAAIAGGGALAAATSALRVAALDLVGGLREARAFGAEDRLRAAVQRREVAQQTALDRLGGRAAVAQACGFLCGQAALLAVLVALMHRGRLEPSAGVGLAFLVVAAFDVVAGLPRAGALAGHAAGSAWRVMQAAAGPLPVAEPTVAAALPDSVALRFEQVRFAWQPDRPTVFDGLTLDLPAGARVAVLGPSGAGKSSLAALALKVVVPQAGRVLLGGTDLAMLRAEDVRRRFSWLSQSTHLFDDTIRANLLLARPDADTAALWGALEAARIGALVRALPDGLDTWVGEGGTRFSGGQSRRLVLARCLLSAAPVLILDEPCAGLDSQTEREFLAALNEGAAGRSVLLIVHRLTGIERLDRIYRLSGGHAVAAAG